ncbi:MAG: hypothetical protein RBU37_24930 [Myxococcota bacterium]|jgi:hypothetical protein|nr:hypothetical protein [Myxococcota bacterium]
MNTFDDRTKRLLEEAIEAFLAASARIYFDPDEIGAQLLAQGEIEPTLPEAVLEARIQKALMLWVKARLEAELSFNQQFPDKPELPWLHKMLVGARLKELASARIVRRGKGFNINELNATYYGRKIVDGLGHSRRRSVLDASEFEALRDACAKIKLQLPEIVEPTVTERFFASDEEKLGEEPS